MLGHPALLGRRAGSPKQPGPETPKGTWGGLRVNAGGREVVENLKDASQMQPRAKPRAESRGREASRGTKATVTLCPVELKIPVNESESEKSWMAPEVQKVWSTSFPCGREDHVEVTACCRDKQGP